MHIIKKIISVHLKGQRKEDKTKKRIKISHIYGKKAKLRILFKFCCALCALFISKQAGFFKSQRWIFGACWRVSEKFLCLQSLSV